MSEARRCRLTGPPPEWNDSDKFGGSWLLGNKELSSKHGVGWSWRLKITKVVSKVMTRKRLEGGRRLEEEASLGRFPPNTVEAKTDGATARALRLLGPCGGPPVARSYSVLQQKFLHTVRQ